MNFVLGEKVFWVSQSGGYTKRKEGEIVAIVPPKGNPHDHALGLGLRCNSSFGYGLPRDHESYLVKIKNQAYWPRVKHLHKLTESK